MCYERIILIFKESLESAEIDLALVEELSSISNLFATLEYEEFRRRPFDAQVLHIKRSCELSIQKFASWLPYPGRLSKFVPLKPREEQELAARGSLYRGILSKTPQSVRENAVSKVLSLLWPESRHPLSLIHVRFLDLVYSLLVFCMKFRSTWDTFLSTKDVQNSMQELQASLDLYNFLQDSIPKILEYIRLKEGDEKAFGVRFIADIQLIAEKLLFYSFFICSSITQYVPLSAVTKLDMVISLKNSLATGLKFNMKDFKGLENIESFLAVEYHQLQSHLEQLTQKLSQFTEDTAFKSFNVS